MLYFDASFVEFHTDNVQSLASYWEIIPNKIIGTSCSHVSVKFMCMCIE